MEKIETGLAAEVQEAQAANHSLDNSMSQNCSGYETINQNSTDYSIIADHKKNVQLSCSNNEPQFCSGYGQYHSNKFNPAKPYRPLRPYVNITKAQIITLVKKPHSVPKKFAQWFIPSTLKTRVFKEQEKDGEYNALWADLDTKVPSLDVTEKTVIEIVGNDQEYLIYTSSSATKKNQKCRIILWMNYPINGTDFLIKQKILNDKLITADITPDRSTEGAAQICYLPNHGTFYDYRIGGIK